VIAIAHETLNANRIAENFRRANPPIIGRIQDDSFMLDLRTFFDPEDLLPRFNDGRR
jgi:seryl-tRNA(Sec) selenium transferase